MQRQRDLGGALGQVVNGWSVSGVGTLQAGLPFSVTDNRGGTIYGASSYAQFAAGKGPADAALPDPTLNQYFNTSANTTPRCRSEKRSDEKVSGMEIPYEPYP